MMCIMEIKIYYKLAPYQTQPYKLMIIDILIDWLITIEFIFPYRNTKPSKCDVITYITHYPLVIIPPMVVIIKIISLPFTH